MGINRNYIQLQLLESTYNVIKRYVELRKCELKRKMKINSTYRTRINELNSLLTKFNPEKGGLE